jgi:hypothetical protein
MTIWHLDFFSFPVVPLHGNVTMKMLTVTV